MAYNESKRHDQRFMPFRNNVISTFSSLQADIAG